MLDSSLFCFLTDYFTDEKASLENKFLGKNGIGELFQGMRKVKVQQGRVTPLKAGKENQLRQAPGPQPMGTSAVALRESAETVGLSVNGWSQFIVDIQLTMCCSFS